MSEKIVHDIHDKLINLINTEINKNINDEYIQDGNINNFEEGCYVIMKNKNLYKQIRVLPKNSNSIYHCNSEFEIKFEVFFNYNSYKILCDTQGAIHFIKEYHYNKHSIQGINKETSETIINMPNITEMTQTRDTIYDPLLDIYVPYYNITINNIDKYKQCIINFKSFYDNLDNLNIKTMKDVINYIMDIN